MRGIPTYFEPEAVGQRLRKQLIVAITFFNGHAVLLGTCTRCAQNR
jgi:hypothetical protein